ncbi:MAG: GldG family protein [Verrucomicrobiales bacterium]
MPEDQITGQPLAQKGNDTSPETKQGDPCPADIPPHQIKRSNIVINVTVQVLCAILLFVMINQLSIRHYKRWDLSAAKKYSISEDTAAYLERLDNKVTLTMAFQSDSKIRNQLKALLDEYDRLGGNQVEFDEFDPFRDKAKALEISDRYEMDIDQNTVFVEVGGRIRKITQADMLDDNGRIFTGEAAITSAMLAATEHRPKKVYLIAGKGKFREVNGRTALEELYSLSKRQFFELNELTLGNITHIPHDADALLLINPETDLSPSEVAVLTDYWEDIRQSTGMVLLLNPATEMPNFYPFLERHGVRVENDYRLLFSQTTGIGGTQKIYSVQSKFLSGSPITSGSAGALTTFSGQTCPISIVKDKEALAARGIVPRALLEADPEFWGDRNHTEPVPTLDSLDKKSPIYIAASVEKGGSEDAVIKLKSSRLVVVGNSTLLDPIPTRSNAKFVMNAINWTLDRKERIDIMPSRVTHFRVNMSAEKYGNLVFLVVLLLPAAVFFFAIFVWSSRRN